MRRKLSALIVSAAVCLIAATAGAGEVPLFGSEILRDGANFTVHQGTFTPGNLYQYLFDRNSDCFCLKISE